MSASFPEMAFWVIFPLAALIVLSGWVMIIISAVKELRAPAKTPGEPGKRKEENKSADVPSLDEPVFHQPSWTPVDGIASAGAPYVPLN
jgi:hypothetical protein